MSVLDVVVVVVVLLQAATGLRRGLAVGALSIVGAVAGAVVAIAVLPGLLARLPGAAGRAVAGDATAGPGAVRAVLAIVAVVVLAGVGRGLGAWLGRRLRGVSPRAVRAVDRAGGGALGAVGALLVLWALGIVVIASTLPVLPGAVRDSKVLAGVDDVVPGSARDWVQRLSRQVDAGTYPALFAPFLSVPVPSALPPDPGVARSGVAARAASATVKVTGAAPACAQALEGSGFVVDPTHVVTNAHVVAGVSAPTVTLAGGAGGPARGQRYAARVVAFDPRVDVAVLAVTNGRRLPVAPLRLADGLLPAGAPALALGYPGDGPLTASPARVRATQLIVGTHIRGAGTVRRQVYALRTVVRPGNSGGPLIVVAAPGAGAAPDPGTVAGLVFATSREDPQTGYALTASQIAATVRAGQGRPATAAVSTGGCA